MSLGEVIVGLLVLLFSILIVVFILFQKGRTAGMSGAIAGGGSDTFLGKNKSNSNEARLARFTKWLAIGFFIVTLVANALIIIKK